MGTDFNGNAFTRHYAEAGLSFVGPSFSRIYDVKIGPWDKLKHVIEPRVDYSFVSNVDNPDEIPAFDEVDNALGLNQVRYAIVNRLLARSAEFKGSAEEIASLEIAQTYAFEFPQTLVPSRPSSRRARPARSRARSGCRGPGLLHLDGRVSYDPYANQLTSATVTAGSNWGPNYVNISWFGSRPVVTTPGQDSSTPTSSAFRRRHRPRQVLPVRHLDRLRRAVEPLPGGPVAPDLQGLLLHGLSSRSASFACRPRRATTTAWSSTSRTSERCSTSTARSTRCSAGGSRSGLPAAFPRETEAPARFGMILRQ